MSCLSVESTLHQEAPHDFNVDVTEVKVVKPQSKNTLLQVKVLHSNFYLRGIKSNINTSDYDGHQYFLGN